MAEFVIVGGIMALSYMIGKPRAGDAPRPSRRQRARPPGPGGSRRGRAGQGPSGGAREALAPLRKQQQQRRTIRKPPSKTLPPRVQVRSVPATRGSMTSRPRSSRVTATRAASSASSGAASRRTTASVQVWGDGSPEVMGADVQPFYSGTEAPGARAASAASSRRMDLYTGTNQMKPRHVESEALFEPAPIGRPHGTPAVLGRAKRIGQLQSAMQHYHRDGEFLAIPSNVARGLGRTQQEDPTMAMGYGGFQQFERDFYMPKSIDQLRPGNDPKETFRGHRAAPAGATVARRAARPTAVRGPRLPLMGEHIATGGGGGVIRPAVAGDFCPSLRPSRRATELNRRGAGIGCGAPGRRDRSAYITPARRQMLDPAGHEAAPAAYTMGTVDTNAELAPVRRQVLNAAGYEAAPAAMTRGTIDAQAQMAPVRKQLLNTTGHEAAPAAYTMGQVDADAQMAPVRRSALDVTGLGATPAAYTVGQVDANAQMAPVRRSALDVAGLEVAPSAGNMGGVDRNAAAEVGPRGMREAEGRVAGAGAATQGVRSYTDVYNATLSESRGVAEHNQVKPAMAAVSAASSRLAAPGMPLGDRSDVLQSRTPGAKFDGPRALGDFGGDVTREQRAVDGTVLARDREGARRAAVPAGPSTMSVSGDQAAGLERAPTFRENNTDLELEIAAHQLARNPLNVTVT